MNSVTDNAILEALTPYDRELIEWCVANLERATDDGLKTKRLRGSLPEPSQYWWVKRGRCLPGQSLLRSGLCQLTVTAERIDQLETPTRLG